MKYFLLFFVLSFTILYANAQDEGKPTIAILPFQFNPNVSLADANAIAQKVESAFINSKRFTVIERTNFQQIFSELETQKNEVYLNSSKLAKQGELIGAAQIVVGNVSSVSAEGTTFNIKIIDVATGQTVGSKDISDLNKRQNMQILGKVLEKAAKVNTGVFSDKSTTDVIGGALLNIDKEIQEFINATFALTYEIAQISKTKGEEATELIIVGGEGDGLKSSTVLHVIQESIMTVGTKKLKNKPVIGKIKVDKVQGDVTLCKVISGGKEIKNLFSPTNKVYASTVTKNN